MRLNFLKPLQDLTKMLITQKNLNEEICICYTAESWHSAIFYRKINSN